MAAKDVALAFADLLRKGDFEAAEKYWSKDVVSIEAMVGPMQVLKGRKAVKEKGVWWNANHTVHRFGVDGPYMNGDQFALIFDVDVTPKDGKRMKMREVALYTVSRGKVTEERFFGPPM